MGGNSFDFSAEPEKGRNVEWIKSLIRSGFPGIYRALHRWRKRETLAALDRTYGRRVAAGPFAGMVYMDASAGSALVPKFVGSYECELHAAFLSLRGEPYAGAIDIGCAEGYYAVGLARILPGVPIFAYDTDPTAQELCRKLAALNHVQEQVQIAGSCGREHLIARSGQRLFVLCDCEGYELDLFDGPVARALAGSDLIIETHEMYRPGCTAQLLSIFSATHAHEIISPVKRVWSDFSAARAVPRMFRRYAVDEWRNPAQRWLWLRSRAAVRKTDGMLSKK